MRGKWSKTQGLVPDLSMNHNLIKGDWLYAGRLDKNIMRMGLAIINSYVINLQRSSETHNSNPSEAVLLVPLQQAEKLGEVYDCM